MHLSTTPTPPHADLPPAPPGPAPQRTFYAVDGGVAVARAAVWPGPLWEGQRTAFIGHDAALSGEAAHEVLNAACQHARELGAQVALGPVNGSTWFSYRLVTDPGTRPPFALEPWNSPAEVARWRSAGFSERLTYHSSLATPETYPHDPRHADLTAKFAGVTIRQPTLEEPQLRRDLTALHDLSLAAFAGNTLYTPLPLPAFEALYRPLLPRVPLDWVWLAEQGGQMVGFLFTYPDPASQALILKTIAIRPGRAWAGLGRHLSNLMHARAFAAGTREVIHALMWDGNESAALSSTRGNVIRRYAVMGKAL